MSNFAATVNSAPPYLVNDIYRKFINPQASERTCVRLSYVASFAVVALGIFLRLFRGFHRFRNPVDRFGVCGAVTRRRTC
jgi:Na+/proline symporter